MRCQTIILRNEKVVEIINKLKWLCFETSYRVKQKLPPLTKTKLFANYQFIFYDTINTLPLVLQLKTLPIFLRTSFTLQCLSHYCRSGFSFAQEKEKLFSPVAKFKLSQEREKTPHPPSQKSQTSSLPHQQFYNDQCHHKTTSRASKSYLQCFLLCRFFYFWKFFDAGKFAAFWVGSVTLLATSSLPFPRGLGNVSF